MSVFTLQHDRHGHQAGWFHEWEGFWMDDAWPVDWFSLSALFYLMAGR